MGLLEKTLKAVKDGEIAVVAMESIPNGEYFMKPTKVVHLPEALNKNGGASPRISITFKVESADGSYKGALIDNIYYGWLNDDSKANNMRQSGFVRQVTNLINFGILLDLDDVSDIPNMIDFYESHLDIKLNEAKEHKVSITQKVDGEYTRNEYKIIK